MAGKIIADQIQHSSAGSLDTQYVVNGSAKAWVNLDATGTPSARDSLNLSTITDNSAGDFTLTWSSSLANANYSVSGMGENFNISSSTTTVLGFKNGSLPSTSSVNLTTCRTNSTSTTERAINNALVMGDLA